MEFKKDKGRNFWEIVYSTQLFSLLTEVEIIFWLFLMFEAYKAKSFWIILNHSESFWIILNHSESFWIILNHSESFWIILNSSLWILTEIIKVEYPENLKKIMCAAWELIAQPIQPISIQIGLDWQWYLAGNSQTAPTIFSKFSRYNFLIISLRTHNPQLPSHFWPILHLL